MMATAKQTAARAEGHPFRQTRIVGLGCAEGAVAC